MTQKKTPVISIGTQSFEKLRTAGSFYIDKTDFICEWWENQDDVTLITRPRRFGKTLNLNMLECFFSKKYENRKELFEGLHIWKQEAYRKLQGQFPVIAFSFADVKGTTMASAREGIIAVLEDLYKRHAYLLEGNILTDYEKKTFFTFGQYVDENTDPRKVLTDTTIAWAVKNLMAYLQRYYKQPVLVFLDEYDTPLQEAYVNGYWTQLTLLIRGIFNSTFKTNEYLGRALLTGITRVSKESIFSDLNNLEVVTTTSEKYASCFGFTEQEVFDALDSRGLSSWKKSVKHWYNGFCFGTRTDIYNPWSITKFLDSKELGTYWADTSSNRLLSELIKEGTPELKMQMEDLLTGNSLETVMEEQVIFEQLTRTRGAIWSLMVASGYLKPAAKTFDPDHGCFLYQLQITNHETFLMFRSMISNWFPEDLTSYGNFKKALLKNDLEYMNQFMNDISKTMFSSFDTGLKPSEDSAPERFYHGFVLGLIVDLSGRYLIHSNKESGFGRYDVIMEPKTAQDDAIIMEFKVQDAAREHSLEAAAQSALKQIAEKQYDTDLISRGIPKERIRHYGFAFQGKRVLICQA